jgi:hypothetical protein
MVAGDKIREIATRAVRGYGKGAALEAARRSQTFHVIGDFDNGCGWLQILEFVKLIEPGQSVR